MNKRKCEVVGLFLCCLAVTVLAYPSLVMSGISITRWSFSRLQTALSKNEIMYFEDQDLSQDPSAGNAVTVHRRLEPSTTNQKVLNTQDSWRVSSSSGSLWPLSLLLCSCPLFLLSLLSVQLFLLFHARGSKWLPHSGQFEINRHLTNILESPFHCLGESLMVLPWLRGPVSLGWG